MKLLIYLMLIVTPLGLTAQTKNEIFKELNSLLQKAEGTEYIYTNSLGKEDKSTLAEQRFSEKELFVSWKHDKSLSKISCESPDWTKVGDVSVKKLSDKLGVIRLVVGKGSKITYTVDGESQDPTLSISFYFKLKDKQKVEELIDKLGRALFGDDVE